MTTMRGSPPDGWPVTSARGWSSPSASTSTMFTYIARGDVTAGHLRPSDTTTADPYIGDAIWWHVHAGGELLTDAAHSYELPRAEAMKIAGLVCFSGDGIETELGT